MSFKYKFGIPEVIAMIVGTLFLVGTGFLMRGAALPYVLETEAIVIVAVSVMFGSSAGSMIAVAATIIYIVVLHVDTSYVHIIAYILMAAGIGHYASYFKVRDGQFGWNEALDFCVIHLLVEGFVWMFFIPFGSFIFFGENLFTLIRENIVSLVFTTLMDLLLVPVFFMVSFLIRREQEHKKNSLKQGLMNR